MVFAALLLLADAGGKVAFKRDYDAALKEAGERSVPVLLYFWCDWSPYCADLDRGALSDDAVVQAAEAFVPVLVDVSKDPQRLREKFRVKFAPSLLFVGSDGVLLDGHKDTWEADRVLRSLRSAARRWGRAFWAESVKQALSAGKKERRLVIAYAPRNGDTDRPEKFLRDALGDLAWSFVYVVAEPEDAACWRILDPEDGRARITLPGDTDATEFRRRAGETLQSWKKK